MEIILQLKRIMLYTKFAPIMI